MLSIGVPLALQLRSVRKRFCVGFGACVASAEVLRGIDLEVATGESVAVVGPAAAGKSTLILCAAGLLKPESGAIEWFGESSRAAAARSVQYHCTPADLIGVPLRGEPQVHLIDLHAPVEASHSMVSWIDERCARGDAVVLVAHDERFARHAATRVLTLCGGILQSPRPMRARVAEHVRG